MKKKIHICLYLNGVEVFNINDVRILEFYDNVLYVVQSLDNYVFQYTEFDKIEVDYYD